MSSIVLFKHTNIPALQGLSLWKEFSFAVLNVEVKILLLQSLGVGCKGEKWWMERWNEMKFSWTWEGVGKSLLGWDEEWGGSGSEQIEDLWREDKLT